MACTRLGAKKCASGVAQPAQLAGHKRPRTLSSGSTASPPLSPLSSLPSSPILQEATHKERSNRFCYLCHDGGNTIACSNHICPHVVCNACIKIPPEVEGILGLLEISFKCPACHEKEEHLAGSKPLPYFAFMRTERGKILPACKTPTFIKGVCKRASKSQVCGGPILILHFVYTGMNTRGSLPRVLNTTLEEYHDQSTLHYHEIIFDFGMAEKLCRWESEAERLVVGIGIDTFEHKIIFVMVHSEVTCGDLFTGKDGNNEDMALLPQEFMIYLFSGCLQRLVSGSTIFMLSCGPLVAFPKSVNSLKAAVVQFKPAYMVAFSADRFISAIMKLFIMAFGVRVLIQGHDLYKVFVDLLDVSIELRMHSDTFLFCLGECMAPRTVNVSSSPAVIGVRYSWYHTHRRPWGVSLPMSCPACSSIRSWSASKVSADSSIKQARVSTC
ncbi:hypothetical protein PISMIDRAFT_98931, partial [Pisolithus microcarpus 441]